MDCCDNKDKDEKDSQQGKKHRGHLSHMLLMILCCGAPIILLLLIPVISNYVSSDTRNLLITILPFLCPILMLFMMPMMMKGMGERQAKQNKDEVIEINDNLKN